MYSLEERLQQRKDFHFRHIDAIDSDFEKAGYNDDNRFWHQARLFAQSITSRFATSENPAVIYEYDARELWYLLIQGAKLIDANHPAQDRLAGQVLYIREMGILSHTIPVLAGDARNGKAGEVVREEGVTSDGKIWADLPFLTLEIQAAWNKKDLPIKQRHNLSSFIARLASWGVRDPELCQCAIWSLRDILETPRPLLSIEQSPEDDRIQQKDLPSVADLLPEVISWFLLAGYKLESLCISGHDCPTSSLGDVAKDANVLPDTGFSVARWWFWKNRLEEISH